MLFFLASFLPFIINYLFQMSVCIGGRGCVCFWEVHVGACVYGCSCVCMRACVRACVHWFVHSFVHASVVYECVY